MTIARTTRRRGAAAALLAAALLAASAGAPAPAQANVCADANGGWFGKWLPNAHTQLINELTYLPSMDAVRVRHRLMDAWQVTWNLTYNECGYQMQPLHTTTVEPGPFTSPHQRPDGANFNGQNQVAFGPIRGTQWAPFGCDGGVLACAPSRRVGGEIVEGDVQFDTAYNWYGGRGSNPVLIDIADQYVPEGWYDLWGVAAHEAGHNLGQLHATGLIPNNSGTHLTMRPQFCHGTFWQNCNPVGGPSSNARTLGLGDYHHYVTNYRRLTP